MAGWRPVTSGPRGEAAPEANAERIRREFDSLSKYLTNFHSVPHARAVRRVMANNNIFTNQSTYADFPNATDKAAMDLTFTKHRDDTLLVVEVLATAEMTSGVGQRMFLGLSVGGTDFDVAMFRIGPTGTRFPLQGTRELSGIASGDLAVKPRFKTQTASAVQFFAADDLASYSITETL